jgi:hypothetical protein
MVNKKFKKNLLIVTKLPTILNTMIKKPTLPKTIFQIGIALCIAHSFNDKEPIIICAIGIIKQIPKVIVERPLGKYSKLKKDLRINVYF